MTNKETIEAFKEATQRMQEEVADQYAELREMDGDDPDPDIWAVYSRLSQELSAWALLLDKKKEECYDTSTTR